MELKPMKGLFYFNPTGSTQRKSATRTSRMADFVGRAEGGRVSLN